MQDNTITIVSRESKLAMWQAEFVANLLKQHHPELKTKIIGITTKGDKILDKPLALMGGKGLFVKELEQHLLDGSADIAVHSMKDVPYELPATLEIAAILARDNHQDVLITKTKSSSKDLTSLPHGAKIGTSSLRRQCQLLAHRSDLQMHTLRGNVITRLNKLHADKLDGIILAAAGIHRLQLKCNYQLLPINIMLPAVGQGALGVECRINDTKIKKLLHTIADANTTYCVRAERAMNAKLNGSCQTPIAGFAKLHSNTLSLHGLVGSPDGEKMIKVTKSAKKDQAIILGQQVATVLLSQGAKEIIDAC